ncbi:MAG: hypothetical protein VYB17_02915, partial [Candidatus Thermoplasmatota archaeon]|nr:hypothetical protein [Candidatus Thermoplasmatota archaeon]
TGPIEFEISEVNDPLQLTRGPLEADDEAVFVVAIHDPDDGTPWTVRTRWDGLVWSEFDADCTASDPSLENPHDWECSISNSMSELYPGAHRLEVQVYENGIWTEEKIYYHTVPIPASNSTDEDNTPVNTVESGIESFSIWVVFSIVVAGVVAIIGLYMIATLSKDDMEEMLGNTAPPYSKEVDEFSDLEVELVEYD